MTEQIKNFATTTLAEDLDNSETVITVTSGAVFPSSGNFRVTCESEIMLCTSISSNDLTVTRGYEGTTAATHANGTEIKHAITAGSLPQIIAENSTTSGVAGCRVTNSTTQSVGTSGPTLTFDTETFDTDGFHSTSSNTGRMTIPSNMPSNGRYLVIASAYFQASTGDKQIWFRVNDTTNHRMTYWQVPGQEPVIDILTLSPGDYVEVKAYQHTTANVGSSNEENKASFAIYLLGSGSIAGFAKEVIGTTAIGASFDTASRLIFKTVTLTKPGFIPTIYVAAKGNGSNVGTIGAALYADNAGVPGALLQAGPVGGYNGIVDIFKSTTTAWIGRPLNAWVEAGTYWLAILTNYNAGAIQVAYDSSGPDYSSTPGGTWFQDSSLSAPSAATRTYSIKADIIYGGQGERGYREASSFPVGAPSGTKIYRTDIRGGMLFAYNSTLNRWLSEQEFVMDFGDGGPYAASFVFVKPIPHDYPIHFTRMDTEFFGSSESWDVKMQTAGYNGTYTDITGTSRSTSGHTDGVWIGYTDTLSYAVDGTTGNSGTTPNAIYFVGTRSSGTTYIGCRATFKLSLAP